MSGFSGARALCAHVADIPTFSYHSVHHVHVHVSCIVSGFQSKPLALAIASFFNLHYHVNIRAFLVSNKLLLDGKATKVNLNILHIICIILSPNCINPLDIYKSLSRFIQFS